MPPSDSGSVMKNQNKKVIAVIGGTGTAPCSLNIWYGSLGLTRQPRLPPGTVGGSVALSLAQNQAFQVRALTRNPGSDKALNLASHGIEIIEADMRRETQVLDAFSGCWGLFLNTDSVDDEVEMSKTVLKLASIQGIRHMVYASLAKTEGMFDGRYPSTAFQSKNSPYIPRISNLLRLAA
jgi:hypothetical protein